MKAKKVIAASSILLAVVCGTGGLIALRDQQQAAEDKKLVEQQLSEVQDIIIKEGESLPDVKAAFAKASMIDQESIELNIQNVDSTVPGSYDVVCTFSDVRGNTGEKIINCEVQPDLAQHVSGMEDITVDYGKPLPEAETEYDTYVESVVRDDSMVNVEEPGTYTITYSVLGKNGEVENVERLATVLDNKPEPTPTPVPAESSSDADGNETNTSSDGISDTNNTASDDATNNGNDQNGLSGNVENTSQNDHTVATGDNTNIIGYVLALLTATLGSFFVLFKKTKKTE